MKWNNKDGRIIDPITGVVILCWVVFCFIMMISCTSEEPESARTAATCRLTRIEEPRENEASTRTDIAYSNGKLNRSTYYTAQPGKDWDYVEERRYTYKDNGMDITITRPTFTINGTFVCDSRGNLLEYSDDYFAHVYRYGYEGNDLSTDDRIKYVVRNGNIVERVDLSTGRTIDRFTYDDHPNPIKGLFYEPVGNDVMEYFRFYNVNNVVSKTEFIPGGLTNVARYSYQYNQYGYPVKQTLVGFDKDVEYTYKCE